MDRGYWSGGYKIAGNTGKSLRVVIDSVTSTECPRSILIRDPQVQDLIKIFNQSQTVKGAMGSPSLWPGAFFDCMALLKEQQEMDHAARMDAV